MAAGHQVQVYQQFVTSYLHLRSNYMNYLRWQIGAALGAILISAVVYATTSAEPVYQDVLDTPAKVSKLTPHTLLNSVVSTGKRLIAVGWRGDIVYSDDQGKSWTQSAVPVSSDLVAVYFPSEKNGWAVGQDGVVLQTSDGGANWTKQLDGRGAAELLSKYYKSSASGALQADVKRYQEQGPDIRSS